mgnify:CR=1 FL=1
MSEKSNAQNESSVELFMPGDDQPQSMLVSMNQGDRDRIKSLKDTLKTMETLEEGMTISSQYLKMHKGESRVLMFLGYVPFEKSNADGSLGEIDAAQFVDAEGKPYINAGVQLVGTMASNGVRPGTVVKITLADEQKTGNGGSVKLYDITIMVQPQTK